MFVQKYQCDAMKQGELEIVLTCRKFDAPDEEAEEISTVARFKNKQQRDSVFDVIGFPLEEFEYGMFNDQTTLDDVVVMAKSQARSR